MGVFESGRDTYAFEWNRDPYGRWVSSRTRRADLLYLRRIKTYLEGELPQGRLRTWHQVVDWVLTGGDLTTEGQSFTREANWRQLIAVASVIMENDPLPDDLRWAVVRHADQDPECIITRGAMFQVLYDLQPHWLANMRSWEAVAVYWADSSA